MPDSTSTKEAKLRKFQAQDFTFARRGKVSGSRDAVTLPL